jgi:hypothetical protein
MTGGVRRRSRRLSTHRKEHFMDNRNGRKKKNTSPIQRLSTANMEK